MLNYHNPVCVLDKTASFIQFDTYHSFFSYSFISLIRV